MVKMVVNTMAAATLIGNIIIAIIIVTIAIGFLFKINYYKKLQKILAPYSYYLVFALSLAATLGSLFLSEIAKFPPCPLCWYQRIFMYPQPILIYLSLLRNEKVITPYLLLLNSAGALVALYHFIIQQSPQFSIIPCQAGSTVSCTKIFAVYYGYITIPVMAFTLFVLNIILLTLSNAKISHKRKN